MDTSNTPTLAVGSDRSLADSHSAELIGRSRAVIRTRELVARTARLCGSVLLVSERGIDVTSVAAELHCLSRAEGRFVTVACGDAVSDVENQVFGVAAHAPSGAEWVTAGSRLAAARGGTLFL